MSDWTTVAGVQLEMVERGQGRPILWLHGEEGLDPDAPLLDVLAAHGRVLAPSHPGFGHSPDADDHRHRRRSRLSLPRPARRTQNARDAVVIGASLGGWIAAEMAVKCADRLGRPRPGGAARHQGRATARRATSPTSSPCHPDEVAAAAVPRPGRAAVDPTTLSDDRADRDRAQSRSHRALRLGAVLPQSEAAAPAAPHQRADALAVGRGRSVRHRRTTTARRTARPSRAPGSRRSPRPGTFPTSSSRPRWSSASASTFRRASAERHRRRRHARLVLQRERVSPAARCEGVRLDPGQLPNRYYDPEARRRSLSPLHRRVDDRRGPGARDHGERAPPDGDQPEPGGGRRHGRAGARHAEGPSADPRQPDRQPRASPCGSPRRWRWSTSTRAGGWSAASCAACPTRCRPATIARPA